MLNVFLDTNIINEDPFWNSNYLQALLNRAKSNEINIIISRVVYEELRSHVIAGFDKNLDTLSSAIKAFEKLHLYPDLDNFLHSYKQINVESLFDEFYGRLISGYDLKIAEYSADIVPRIVKQSIEGKIGCKGQKDGVRDFIIWLTCLDYATENNLENCILITNNVNDFCKSEPVQTCPKVFKISPKLDNGTNLFSVFTSLHDFFLKHFKLPISYDKGSGGFLHKVQFDYKYLSDIIYMHGLVRLGHDVDRKLDLSEVEKSFNQIYGEVLNIQVVNLDTFLRFQSLSSEEGDNYIVIKGLIELKPNIEARLNTDGPQLIEKQILIKAKCEIYINPHSSDDFGRAEEVWGKVYQINIEDPKILNLNIGE